MQSWLRPALCAALCVVLGACAGARNSPPQQARAETRALSLPPAPPPTYTPSSQPVSLLPGRTAPGPAPIGTGPITPSNPSTAIVAVNRSVAQPLGPNSPPPSSFENSCAPAPYLFQSKAGYEAVRVKDCATDQLLYLPSSAQVQIAGYQAECLRRCGQ
jgi:hypothetical protein